MKRPEVDNVDDYIKENYFEIQDILNEIRKIIFSKHPSIIESFAYGMPAYKLNGQPLLYFGAFKKHIGFYALPSGHSAFAEKLVGYKQSKGSVQFPLNKPIPYKLIEELIELRVKQVLGN
jgi:uncharacterized protein YdhG (YjbR/CyaY superfamily)